MNIELGLELYLGTAYCIIWLQPMQSSRHWHLFLLSNCAIVYKSRPPKLLALKFGRDDDCVRQVARRPRIGWYRGGQLLLNHILRCSRGKSRSLLRCFQDRLCGSDRSPSSSCL